MGISASLGSSALLPAGLGFRNKIINGDMRVVQRGTAAVTGSGSPQYPVDRWIVYNGTGTVTFAQSTIAPAGYTNSLNATVTATGSYGTGGYTEIGQMVEGFNCQDLAWGTASAKLITVSFWVRSSVTGIYNVAFQNNGQNRSYIASFTINAANTWEYETIQIPGDTSGTWLTDSGVGLRMWLQLGMGTNYDTTGNTWAAGNLGSTSGAIDFAANSGATFYVTGVQLEQNYQPTPFEQRPIGVELALCQRYYWRNAIYGAGAVGGSGAVPIITMSFKTPMRASPTITYVSGGTCMNGLADLVIGSAYTPLPVRDLSADGAELLFYMTTGSFTNGDPVTVKGAIMQATAEL